MKSNHDLTGYDIYVDTVITQINLSYNNSIGEPNVNDNLQITDRLLCEVILKEKNNLINI